MKKILYIASTFGHLLSFHIPYVAELLRQGYEVHMAGADSERAKNENAALAELLANYDNLKVLDIPFEKRFFSRQNLVCKKTLQDLILKEKYDTISVHTSLAAFWVRLAVKCSVRISDLRKKGKAFLINTMHGYLFCENSPIYRKLPLLMAERLVASVTDRLVVMNAEDYRIAMKYGLCRRAVDSKSVLLSAIDKGSMDNIADNSVFSGERLVGVHLINGIGFDGERFNRENVRASFRRKAGVSPNTLLSDGELRSMFWGQMGVPFHPDDIVLIYAAEFSSRKNQMMLIEGLALLDENIKLILAGKGDLQERCMSKASELGIADRIYFSGHVSNLNELYFCCDGCVSASRSEGLPFNIMEALAMGLPCIVSDVKGNNDLVHNYHNGLLFRYNDRDEFAMAVRLLYGVGKANATKLVEIGAQACDRNFNTKSIASSVEKYSLAVVFKESLEKMVL